MKRLDFLKKAAGAVGAAVAAPVVIAPAVVSPAVLSPVLVSPPATTETEGAVKKWKGNDGSAENGYCPACGAPLHTGKGEDHNPALQARWLNAARGSYQFWLCQDCGWSRTQTRRG